MARTEELDALIARAQEGDVRAFELLVADHTAQVRRFARAYVSSPADADDLAQEALLKVYRSLRLFRYQSAFSTWLYTVVRNTFLDLLKSRGQRERQQEKSLEAGDTEMLAGGAAPDEQLEQAEERQRLWAAVRQIPVEFRNAVVLFDIEGHSYDEVAAIESIAVGTVKSRLSRGRAHLRRLLEDEGTADAIRSPTSEVTGTSSLPGSSNPGRSR